MINTFGAYLRARRMGYGWYEPTKRWIRIGPEVHGRWFVEICTSEGLFEPHSKQSPKKYLVWEVDPKGVKALENSSAIKNAPDVPYYAVYTNEAGDAV